MPQNFLPRSILTESFSTGAMWGLIQYGFTMFGSFPANTFPLVENVTFLICIFYERRHTVVCTHACSRDGGGRVILLFLQEVLLLSP